MRKPAKQLLPGIPEVLSTDDFKDQADKLYQELEIKDKERQHRELISKRITTTFITLNILIYLLVLVMYSVDVYFRIIEKTPLAIIDTKIVMTLIGATTVQLGALMLAMGKWLFPSGNR